MTACLQVWVCQFLLQAPPLDARAIDAAVEQVLREHKIPGAVVALAHAQELKHHRAYGFADLARRCPMSKETIMHIGSVTKVFTATLLAQLARAGKVDLDDPVAKYLPTNVPIPDWAGKVRLRHLATHTSGLPRDPVNRRNLPGSPTVMEPYSIQELCAGLQKTSLQSEPGEKWAYSNLGYALLGHLLERATGSSFEELLRSHLLVPLQMKDTGIRPSPEQESRFASGYWTQDNPPVARARWQFGEVAAFAGMFSTAEDLNRFMRAQLVDGNGVIDKEVVHLLHTPTISVSTDGRRRMGLGWFVDAMPGGITAVGHGGEVDSYSACVVMLPKQKLTLVVLANQGGKSAETLCRAVMSAALSPKRTP